MSGTGTTLTTSDQPANPPSIPVIKTREGAITKVTGDGLTGPNWVTWQVQMMLLLALCEVEPYVHSEIQQPNKEEDPIGHDNYAKHLITQNVGDESIIHIQHGSTSSYVAWKNLEAIYEDKSQETAVAIIWNLWHTTAEEDNISEHLNTLKKYWEHLNLVNDESFKIPEVQFKIAIISSLPPSWDNFTQPYISIRKGDSGDPKLVLDTGYPRVFRINFVFVE